MIKLKDLLNESLTNARKVFLQSGRVDSKMFNKLLSIDITKNKKYIEWICSRYVESPEKFTDSRIKDLGGKLLMFDNFVTKKFINGVDADIYRYNTIQDFYNKLKTYYEKYKVIDSERLKTHDYILVLQKDWFKILKPNTFESAFKYSRHTNWCIGRKVEDWDKHCKLEHTYYMIVPTSGHDFVKLEKSLNSQITGSRKIDASKLLVHNEEGELMIVDVNQYDLTKFKQEIYKYFNISDETFKDLFN